MQKSTEMNEVRKIHNINRISRDGDAMVLLIDRNYDYSSFIFIQYLKSTVDRTIITLLPFPPSPQRRLTNEVRIVGLINKFK